MELSALVELNLDQQLSSYYCNECSYKTFLKYTLTGVNVYVVLSGQEC